MTKTELMELIANGENSGVEFKRDDVRPEQLAKEIVALVNFRGGRVLLGVEDDGNVSGIQRLGLEEWVMDTVFGRYVHPMILPFYEEVLIEEGLRVAVITMTQGTAKPYVVRHKGSEEIYLRVGSVSRKASREQQARLFALGGMLHTETLPVSGSSLADLDLDRLDDYLRNVLKDPEIPSNAPEWQTRLCGMGFLTEREDGDPVCSIAGLLLFGNRPRRLLRQAGVRWMAFAGQDIDSANADDAVLDGPLVGLWRVRHGSRVFDASGVMEQLFERMRPHITMEQTGVGAALRREQQWFYPPEALREAVVNAFAHRDWTRSEEIEIVSYSDRLFVKSPGAMQNSMTVGNYSGHPKSR
ncbi:helix-turn-helix domain-containing protein [Thiohalocapsa marina]|uniref:AlbA family DNA-binding domain-containing protein n=1 Tax=Thiohalocapsa marina TaxID=424902 RepID=UPI0036DD7440